MNPYRIVTRRLNFFEKLINATYSRLFLMWIGLNLLFTFAYFALTIVAPEHGPNIPQDLPLSIKLFDSIYFAGVTATTIGYGDIIPLGFSKVLAVMQSASALLVFTVLVGKLVSQRQDTTLHEVHRMTFEGIFYHIRHVMFIVRQDFDAIIQKVHERKELTETDWKNLSIAYLQAHSLIEEIPELYESHGYDLHNTNMNRERLLFESLQRTLMRIHTLMLTLDSHNIDWKSHEPSLKEMRRLVDVVDAVMPVWRERSPFHEEQEFEEIFTLASQLHHDMKKAIAV